MKDLNKAFDEFLENPVYDIAQDALYQLVRSAYAAGYQAAKSQGILSKEHNIVRVAFTESQSYK